MVEALQREEIERFSARLETHFRDIHRRVMADAPICNPALDVACVGFSAWGDKYLGVLVTPWFMNLRSWRRFLLSRRRKAWLFLAAQSSFG